MDDDCLDKFQTLAYIELDMLVTQVEDVKYIAVSGLRYSTMYKVVAEACSMSELTRT